MTQRLEAERILEDIKPATEEQLKQLHDVVARAQNQPQHGGEADGSINEHAWEALHLAVGALATFKRSVRDFKETL